MSPNLVRLFVGSALLLCSSAAPVDTLPAYTGYNSDQNDNTKEPATQVFPTKAAADAPYSLPAGQLRGAIYIPSSFGYGATPPLIMVPGTGSTGFLTFTGNFIKQFTGSPFADPVWLNIPDYLYDDAQLNSEYVAYAINYISGISDNKNVSVIAWSQGNLDTQWALKYWPSTRSVVSDFISISPDFHGTEVSYQSCTDILACPPAVIQQEYDSGFVTTLRKDGGDSAYVVSYTHRDTMNGSRLTNPLANDDRLYQSRHDRDSSERYQRFRIHQRCPRSWRLEQ